MPYLYANNIRLEYTTTQTDSELQLNLKSISKMSDYRIGKYRTIAIKINNKSVVSVVARKTPTVKQILSTVNHKGKATKNQRREAEYMHKVQLNNNIEEAWNRFLNEYTTKKNNNQLIFHYTRGENEKNITVVFSVFGTSQNVTLKVPRSNDGSSTPYEHEETKTIGIENVNDGKNYVINEEAYAKYGHIERVVDFSDVEDEKQLLSLANTYVNNLQFDDVTIEVSAVDLHHLTGSTPSFELLDEVRCVSRPHGLNKIFPITEINIPLDDPSGVTYKMGRSGSTTMSQSTAANASDLFKRMNNIPAANKVLDLAKEEMSAILNTRTTGYVNIVHENDISQALIISNRANWKQATKLWKFDINGLGYSDSTISNAGRYDNATTISADGRLYKIGMTMDGTIVADFIKTGLLEDGLGYNYWNLSTGDFRLSSNTLLDSDGLDGSIVTIEDIIDQNENIRTEARAANAIDSNSSNILRRSNDLSVLNQNAKYWSDGCWKTSVSVQNDNRLSITVIDSYSNSLNQDIPNSGITKAIEFYHDSTLSSSESAGISQEKISIGVDTIYTLACYTCGNGTLSLRASGRGWKEKSVFVNSIGWTRYNLVFKVVKDTINISSERSRLQQLKREKQNQATTYKNMYDDMVASKQFSTSQLKAAKKRYSDVKKEINQINTELDELEISINRSSFKTIDVSFRHYGSGTLYIAGMTLTKGNVSKDWQPSEYDYFSIETSIESRLNVSYLMNKLTQNGKKQGVYFENGQLLINAEYIMVGLLTDQAGKNAWDLKSGTIKTTNMVAENIQASGILQNMKTTGYGKQKKGVVIDLGKTVFYNDVLWYDGVTRKPAGVLEATNNNSMSFQTNNMRYDIRGVTVYPYHLTSANKKGAETYVLSGGTIVRIQGLAYNTKKKIVNTTLAELRFVQGLLVDARVYIPKTKKLSSSKLSTRTNGKNNSVVISNASGHNPMQPVEKGFYELLDGAKLSKKY